MRLAGQAKGGYYPTPPRVTEYIGTVMRPDNRDHDATQVIRIFDPCCGPGEALADLAESIRQKTRNPVHTYGVELHHERSLEAAGQLDFTLSSDIFNTSITNNTFGAMFLNPPYDQDAGPEDRRTEHTFLVHCTKYLAPYGTLIYIVPKNRLHHSARFLSSQYNNINVFDFPHPEVEVFSQCVLTARRTSSPYPNPHTEKWLHELADRPPNHHPLEPQRESAYIILPDTDEPITFMTRMGNPITAATEARTHGLWAHARTADLLWPKETLKTRPLMPLRKGHMAVLMAAGFLNNLAIESEGDTILVKGTTTKEEYVADEDEDSTTYRQRITATITTLNMNTGEVERITA